MTPTGTPSPSAAVSFGLSTSQTASPTASPTINTWRVNGAASSTGGQFPITLTPSTTNQAGSAVWPGKVTASGFSIQVQLQIDAHSSGGADGASRVGALHG